MTNPALAVKPRTLRQAIAERRSSSYDALPEVPPDWRLHISDLLTHLGLPPDEAQNLRSWISWRVLPTGSGNVLAR